MRLTSFSSASLALLSLSGVQAIITGLTAPSTITAGTPFTVTLTTADYIQSVYDVSVVFGINLAPSYSGEVGYEYSPFLLGADKSNTLDPLPFTLTFPANTPKGESILASAVTSLYGVLGGPEVTIYNTTVTVV